MRDQNMLQLEKYDFFQHIYEMGDRLNCSIIVESLFLKVKCAPFYDHR